MLQASCSPDLSLHTSECWSRAAKSILFTLRMHLPPFCFLRATILASEGATYLRRVLECLGGHSVVIEKGKLITVDQGSSIIG